MAESVALAGRATGEAAHPVRPGVLVGIVLAGCGAAAVAVALALTSDHVPNPGLRAALLDWVVLPYVLAGAVAWWRRPESRLGPLMVAAGFATALGALSWANTPLPLTVGELFDFLAPVVFLHVFLAYPSGRLRGSLERCLVVAAYATALGLQLVRMLLDDTSPRNLAAVAHQPAAATAIQKTMLCALSAFALAGVGVLVLRRLRAGRPLRRSLDLLVDSFALGLVMIAALFIAILLGWPGIETIRRTTFGVMGIAPTVFLVGLLGARLARTTVGDLVVELRARPAPEDLRHALARALRDPSLELAYWLPEFACYADIEGRPVELPSVGSRASTRIDRDGARVAVLVHDAALREEPELLAAVAAAAGIALENAQLQADLRARMQELRGSRARILEAGRLERQRLERNLHDGAQQRLIALSLELGRLQEGLAGDPDTRRRIDEVRRGIATSLEELRDLARGLHPAVVSGHGLEVALEQLVARAPVPVHLSLKVGGRLPEPLEVVAYYLVAESLANTGKHAQATSASVEVARSGPQLVVEIADDGIGGADTERGSGLRGLADRVETLDGRLRVWSPPGGGTRVRAEIPCEP